MSTLTKPLAPLAQRPNTPLLGCCVNHTPEHTKSRQHMSSRMDAHSRVEVYQDFLREYYWDEVGELIQKYPNEQTTLRIDYMDLWRYDAGEHHPNLADAYREKADREQDRLNEALRTMDVPADIELGKASVAVVPPENGSFTIDVEDVRNEHRGRYVAVDAQVTNRTKVLQRITKAVFECQRCGTNTPIHQAGDEFQEPHQCQGCERQGPFKLNMEQSQFENYQRLRLQEPPDKATGAGREMEARVTDDLTDSVEAGSRVEFGGIVRLEQKGSRQKKTTHFEPYLEGKAPRVKDGGFDQVDISEHKEQFTALANGEHGDPYDLLTDCVDPNTVGHSQIKLALVLQLFGGVRVSLPDGSQRRGDSHICLLGDPGTSKSTLLHAVRELAPRATFASGKNTTAAGMTAAAVQNEWGASEYSLEAGALVRANKGIACLDEIDKVPDDALSSLHSALEQQAVEVQKADIDATLPAKTALLAAGNPKYGRFEDDMEVAKQIDFEPTLLSRFDLVFMVKDEPGTDMDKEVTKQMIKNRTLGVKHTRGEGELTTEQKNEISRQVDAEVIRSWVAYARQNIYPTIEDEDVYEDLHQSFMTFRTANGGGSDTPVPVTRRKLEGILRLAEASARIRLSETITKEDVDRARELVGRCLRDVGIDPENGQLDVDVIETGQSKSQRDRLKTLEELVRDLQDEYEDGAPHGEIVDAAGGKGISARKVEDAIQKLKDQGTIYMPEDGHYRVV